MDILYAFIQAETWAESRRILEAHPELLSEEADALIKRLIENAQQENDEEKAMLLNNHRIILNHSRKWCMTSPRAGRPKTSPFKRCCGKPGSGVLRPSMCGWIVGIRLLRNLKLIASFGWFFRTRLKSDRLVNPDRQGNRPIRKVEIPTEGRVAHRKGFGLVRVFWTVSPNGDAEYGATNDLKMTEEKRQELERKGWGIEVYHRGLKQCCGVERAQVRKAVSILGHLLLALRAFLRLEAYRLRTGRTILPGRHLAHRCPSPPRPTRATPLLRQKVGATPAPFVELSITHK